MHKLVCFVALAVALLVACVPPPPSPPAYEKCSPLNTAMFGCELYTVNGFGGTYAQGGAWTSEPPTFISIELALEQRQPDGSFTGIWTDRFGLGSPTQSRTWLSQTIQCEPGVYQWSMRVRFTGFRTTYYTSSGPFLMP